MDNLDYKIISTGDGSDSLLHPIFQELHHSKYGAHQESQHIFIEYGIEYFYQERQFTPDHISIFEMGFGSGLNALLALKWSEDFPCKIIYHAIEKYPVAFKIISELNYRQICSNVPHIYQSYLELHDAVRLKEVVEINDSFEFNPIQGDIRTAPLPDKIDIIFYDAFAPNCQPELWDKDVMKKMFDILNPGGILVTYCAKGSFKRTLIEVGFDIQSPPGPNGKREITLGIKPKDLGLIELFPTSHSN